MSVNWNIDFSELERIQGDLAENVEKVVKAAGFEIEAEAKKIAPRDTGAMANSIYTVTRNYNGYSSAKQSAQASAGKRKTNFVQLPRIQQLKNKIIARIGPSVDYGVYVELGGRGRAQPYLSPAVEKTGRFFSDSRNWEDIFK